MDLPGDVGFYGLEQEPGDGVGLVAVLAGADGAVGGIIGQVVSEPVQVEDGLAGSGGVGGKVLDDDGPGGVLEGDGGFSLGVWVRRVCGVQV